jgi:hypothetical protein
MNESDLEDQLRALAPAAPSAELAERIGRQLAATSPSVRTAGVLPRPAGMSPRFGWLRNLGWAVAGAAATIATMFAFSGAPKDTKPSLNILAASTVQVPEENPGDEEQAFEPTETSHELIAVENSKVLLETEEGPVREVRYTYLERLAWAQPGTGARLEVEVPREDVYLLPVSLQ